VFDCVVFDFGEKNSMFCLKDADNGLTKASQWWILHRNDVKTIIETDIEYRKVFHINRKSDGAFDEFYFLSLLKWNNPNYVFVDKKIVHDDFQNGTVQRNPKIFNKFIKQEVVSFDKILQRVKKIGKDQNIPSALFNDSGPLIHINYTALVMNTKSITK
jgi:hypothetical protein